MKALTLRNNAVLDYIDVPCPQLADDEVLVAVKFSGICNSDIFRAYGNGAYFYPLIMGHEFAGVVEQVGKKARKFKKGDRVAVFPLIPCFSCEFCKKQEYALCQHYDYYGSRRNGGFAEFVAVKEWNLFKIPREVSLQAAAMLEPLAVAVHVAKKIKPNAGSSILVFGAGLIGLAIAKLIGQSVNPNNIVVVDRNNGKLEIARKFCGVKIINIDRQKAWLGKYLNKFDLVVEACGSVATFVDSLGVARAHGSVVWVGNIQGTLALSKAQVGSILRKELKIIGCWNAKFRKDWTAALTFIKNNRAFCQAISGLVPLRSGRQTFAWLHKQKTSLPQKRVSTTSIKTIFYLGRLQDEA